MILLQKSPHSKAKFFDDNWTLYIHIWEWNKAIIIIVLPQRISGTVLSWSRNGSCVNSKANTLCNLPRYCLNDSIIYANKFVSSAECLQQFSIELLCLERQSRMASQQFSRFFVFLFELLKENQVKWKYLLAFQSYNFSWRLQSIGVMRLATHPVEVN